MRRWCSEQQKCHDSRRSITVAVESSLDHKAAFLLLLNIAKSFGPQLTNKFTKPIKKLF